MRQNSSACHAYVMWEELGHSHFAISNVVTTGNSTGIKNVLKWNRALGFEFSIQSSVYGATAVAKVSLFSTRHGLLYIHVYRTSSNLYTPDSVSLARPLLNIVF